MTADDLRPVRRRTAYIAAGQSAVKGSQLVIALLLVHLLAPDDWNRVAFLLSIHLAAVTLGTLNLQHGLLFFFATVPHQRALVVRTASLMAGVGALIAALLTLAAGPLGGSMDVSRWLPWIGLAILLELPTACMPTTFIALERARSAALWDIGTTVVQLIAIAVPAALGAGPGGVVGGLVLAAGLRCAAFVVVLGATTSGSWSGLPTGTFASQIRYGLPLGLTLAAGVLNRSVDKWLIAAFRPHDVGIYSIAAQEIPLLAVLPYAGGAAVAAQLVADFRHGRTASARRWWMHQTASMSKLVVPMSACLIVLAPQLFTLLIGSRGAAGVLPFQLFTAITMHRVAEYGLVLRAADRNRSLVVAACVLLVGNAALAGLGAALWGMPGAAAGTLAANVIAWVVVLRQIGHALETTVAQAFPWRTWTSSVLGAATAALAASVAGAWVARLLAGSSATTWPVLVAKAITFATVALTAARLPALSTARDSVFATPSTVPNPVRSPR